MKIPGPDHPITITHAKKRIQVLFGGHLIADTTNALELKEAAYKAVFYVPREAVEMAVLARTDRSTHCPYKGDASYYTITRDAAVAENAVWSYEAPFPAMEQIRGYLAFYPNQVEIVEFPDEDMAGADRIRDAIEHTDSGAGSSQRDHWPDNTVNPG